MHELVKEYVEALSLGTHDGNIRAQQLASAEPVLKGIFISARHEIEVVKWIRLNLQDSDARRLAQLEDEVARYSRTLAEQRRKAAQVQRIIDEVSGALDEARQELYQVKRRREAVQQFAAQVPHAGAATRRDRRKAGLKA